jgi:hypothetical protein
MIVALLENKIVTEIYKTDSYTPFDILFPNKEAVVVSSNTGIPFKGYEYQNGKFVKAGK